MRRTVSKSFQALLGIRTSNETMNRLRKLATAFTRELSQHLRGIDEEPKDARWVSLGYRTPFQFPMGGCAKSSRLFGQLLLRDGVRTDLVVGQYRDDKEREHTWLEHDTCVIDLTCCQFDGSNPVAKCPYANPHVSKSNISWYSQYWPQELRSRYFPGGN